MQGGKPIIKLKVKTGGGAAPPQPPASQQPGGPPPGGWAPQGAPPAGLHPAPSGSQQVPASSGAPPAAKQPFRFKVKVGGAAEQPQQPPRQQWAAPAAAAAPPPVRPKREAPPEAAVGPGPAFFGEPAPKVEPAAAPGPPLVKKIKLATGKAAPGGGGGMAAAAAPGGPKPLKKPIIKFKPPPKQPRDAAAAAAVDAAAAADGGGGLARQSTLPIVRLTLPVVAGAPPGAPRRLKSIKAKGPKVGAGAPRPKVKVGAGKPKLGGGAAALGAGRKGKPGRKKRAVDEFDFDFDSDEDYAGSPEARPARRASKRSRADIKELKDLGLGEADLEDWDPEEPLVPRTWGLRSKHAADKAAAPSSTGLGLSAGGPAPSDARTGAGGGAEAADTAGTDQLWGGLGESGAAEGRRRMPAVPAVPTGPPKREDFERLLVRCQKKDVHSMFKDPVTEAIAPGYFSVIKQPMDFSTMKTKAVKGEYSTWEELRADMKLMFSNALTYNSQGGTVWNYAKLLAGQCDRIVELAMQGKTNVRASAMMTRKHNAAVKAQQKAERDKLRGQMRAEQRAAQEAKVLKKAGLASAYDEHDDENIRASYMRPVRDANVRAWRGLGAGTSSEGVAWGNGRQVLRPVNPWLPPGMYALSLARFAARLPPGRARDLVMARARASTAADSVAERLLQQQLAKKVPLPPPMPTPTAAAQAPAAAAPGVAAAAGLPGGAARLPTAGVAAMPNAAAMMQAQQQLLLAQQARPGGLPGMLPGAMVPGAAGLVRPGQPGGLPPGATIQLVQTPQGLRPFLIQPGQPPVMLPGLPGMPAGMPALAPGTVIPGMVAPGIVQPRPAGK